MINMKLWITLLLTMITLALIGWNIADVSDSCTLPLLQGQAPTYQMHHIVTIVYNQLGKLSYKLEAAEVKYYTLDALGLFIQPLMVLFDEKACATWSLQADKAKLTKNQMLYLYGHVELNNLMHTSKLISIKTDNAQINLNTQDLYSDKETTFCGTNFSAHGMQMRGNLRTKTAELINNVKSKYEMQN